uniref:Putative secreted protein n=1 Tax=Ixodes ricinus TaxID=34613 RepID=A0A147BCY0_IXORI
MQLGFHPCFLLYLVNTCHCNKQVDFVCSQQNLLIVGWVWVNMCRPYFWYFIGSCVLVYRKRSTHVLVTTERCTKAKRLKLVGNTPRRNLPGNSGSQFSRCLTKRLFFFLLGCCFS